MKKIILTALFLAAFSASALAAALSGTTTIGSMAFSTSNNVTLSGISTVTSYVVESKHASGSRVFATDGAASKIYWKDGLTFTTTPAAPTTETGHGTPDVSASPWVAL